MIATRDLRELASFAAVKTPVLSLYLDADLSTQLKEQVKLVLRDLLDKGRAQGAPGEDLERIARFVDFEYDWQGKGLIVFSCQADGLWQIFTSPVPIVSQVFTGERAYLLPLANLLDRYAPYAVVVVDQEGSRQFLVDMGGIVKEQETMGEPIKHQKQGGQAAERFQRHVDRLAQNNLKAAVDALAHFCDGNDCQRLILGGTEQNTARFRDMLPMPLRQAVLGSVPLDMMASRPQVVERSRKILDEVEEERQRALVQQIITYAAKGGVAVTGLADTLVALQEGRVMTLLVHEGFSAPGFYCPDCDYLTVNEAEHCLSCGKAQAEPVANIVERALHKAFLQDAKVQLVADSPELAAAGHIGALLRY